MFRSNDVVALSSVHRDKPSAAPVPQNPLTGRPSVLLIADEADLVDLLSFNLEREHLQVIAARDEAEAYELAREQSPNLILVNDGDALDGTRICRTLRSIRQSSRTPIILLSTREAVADRIIGLESGADDYVVKPFAVAEVAARVRAGLRRVCRTAADASLVHHGDVVIDPRTHQVTVDGTHVSLTPTEFRVMLFLSDEAPRTVSRDEIVDQALAGELAVVERAVDVHISSLRRKLGKAGKHLQTVRGFGYRLATVSG